MVIMTLYELIVSEYRATGKKGNPPREWVANWRLAFPTYGDWPLNTRFRSGSTMPIRPEEFAGEHPDEIATETPKAKESRERHEAGLKYSYAKAAEYQKARNAEEIAKGKPPPFEEWWLEE
jgi:hypothetical protein